MVIERKSEFDPITAQVVRDSLEAVSREMSRVVERSAVHPLFQEVHDYSTGVFFYDGSEVSLIARATAIPCHIFAAVLSVEALLKDFKDDVHEGDIFLLNDPYYGGSHQADWTMMRPIFLGKGRGMLIPSVRAHMSDFGGVVMGGYNIDARDAWQEGYRLPPLRLFERGKLREDVWDLVVGNSRLTETVHGDLLAIVGGCNVGARRVEGLIDKYGEDVVADCVDYTLDHAHRTTAAEIDRWPDGTYMGERVLDHDAAGNRDILVRATVTIEGSHVTISFEGSSDQVPGFVNSPFGNTASHAFTSVCAVLPPEIPINSGMFRNVEIVAPEGSVVNPIPPAPVMFSTVVIGYEVADAVMKAFEQAIPDRTGSIGVSYNILNTFGIDDRTGVTYFNTDYGQTAVSAGGALGTDGWGGMSAPAAALTFANIESQEQQYPYLYERYEYVDDSCAAGEYRGVPSFAMRRVLLGTKRASIVAAATGSTHALPGYVGGEDGATNMFVLRPGAPDEIAVDEALAATEIVQGDVIETLKGGGGGWGQPMRRHPARVLEDVLDGYVSVDTAAGTYGVIIVPGPDGALTVDEAETKKRRR